MFYITSHEYVGPNPEQNLNSHTYQITTECPRGNSGERPEITDGWLGTTCDWSSHAHGEFDTEEEARVECLRLLEEYGGYREPDYFDDYQDEDNNVIQIYLVGKYEELGSDGSQDWCYVDEEQITANTTDEEIDELVEQEVDAAHSEGFELDVTAVFNMFKQYRDELQEEESEE